MAYCRRKSTRPSLSFSLWVGWMVLGSTRNTRSVSIFRVCRILFSHDLRALSGQQAQVILGHCDGGQYQPLHFAVGDILDHAQRILRFGGLFIGSIGKLEVLRVFARVQSGGQVRVATASDGFLHLLRLHLALKFQLSKGLQVARRIGVALDL